MTSSKYNFLIRFLLLYFTNNKPAVSKTSKISIKPKNNLVGLKHINVRRTFLVIVSRNSNSE